MILVSGQDSGRKSSGQYASVSGLGLLRLSRKSSRNFVTEILFKEDLEFCRFGIAGTSGVSIGNGSDLGLPSDLLLCFLVLDLLLELSRSLSTIWGLFRRVRRPLGSPLSLVLPRESSEQHCLSDLSDGLRRSPDIEPMRERLCGGFGPSSLLLYCHDRTGWPPKPESNTMLSRLLVASSPIEGESVWQRSRTVL